MNETKKKLIEEHIEVIRGDITTLKVDAIVNAANKKLLGGGGVDGAIHRAAGPGLLEECRKLGGAETGESKITKGYGLPAKHVIHTVGPVWNGGERNEAVLLKSCYLTSFELAGEYSLKSVAFPSVSTGIYHYPVEEAARIALEAVIECLQSNKWKSLEKIYFVCFDERTEDVYRKLLKHFTD